MLTLTQLQALHTFLQTDATMLALPNSPDGDAARAVLFNLLATPDFWVWKMAVTRADLVNSVGPDGTTFTWTGNGFITRSAGEQAAWRELFEGTGTVNAAQTNVRQAFSDIFSGTGNAAANRTHLLAVARRKATVAEKVLATGTGSTGSPATAGWEGAISLQDVQDARNS
jgi:hypothetical protein